MSHPTNSYPCDCCSTCPPLYTPSPNCHHCPYPPPIPNCGCNELGEPYWHTLHPLLPMARYMQCGNESCLTDEQLACNMRLSEPLYSTCRLSGYNYYHAIIYHAFAIGEYATAIALYRANQSMTIALGKGSKQPLPTLYNSGVFGMQLQMLLDNIAPNTTMMIGV